MYTVHLASDPTFVYGHTTYRSDCAFDHRAVTNPKKFKTLCGPYGAKEEMRTLYLKELQLPDSFLEYRKVQEDYKWNLCYILSKNIDGVIVDHTKYYLQCDGSLKPEEDSTDARKFDTYDDAYRHMKQLGILMSCFCIPATTEDF